MVCFFPLLRFVFVCVFFCSKKRKEIEPSPSLSDVEKDSKKESRDEEFKGPLEPKEYGGFQGIGRPRGTFVSCEESVIWR